MRPLTKEALEMVRQGLLKSEWCGFSKRDTVNQLFDLALKGLFAPTEEQRNTVIEECAMVAETYSSRRWSAYKSGPINGPDRANPHVQGESDGATDVAEAIRALKAPVSPPREPSK